MDGDLTFMSLAEIMKMFGHDHVTLLKADIVGTLGITYGHLPKEPMARSTCSWSSKSDLITLSPLPTTLPSTSFPHMR